MGIKIEKDKPIKLDKLDHKIIHCLLQNYRDQRRKIAKALKISEKKLSKRIRRLEEAKVIEPHVALNFPKLKIQSFMLFFENLTKEEADRLEKSGQVFHIIHLLGHKRYNAVLLTKDIETFSKKYFPGRIPEIYPITAYKVDRWNPHKLKIEVDKKPKKTKPEVNLKTKDYKILYGVAKHPSDSNFQLSQKIQISRQTIKKTLKKLEEGNIITSYRFTLNTPKANHLLYFLEITCIPEETKQIAEQIHTHHYTGFLHQSYNKLFFQFLCFEHNDLSEFLDTLEKQFPKTKTEVFQATGDAYFDPTPPYVLEEIKKRSEKKEQEITFDL